MEGEELKEAIFSYLKSQARRLDMAMELFKRIEGSDGDWLKSPFSKEEVHLALSKLSSDKVPGLDCFSMAFRKFCW